MASIRDALLLKDSNAPISDEQAKINAEISERRWENVRWVTIVATGVFIGLAAHSLVIYLLLREWVERSI
jgi:hypothetical protein